MSANDGAAIAPTIQEILGDEDLAMLFREYLHQLQCAENLSFYIEAEDYKRISGEADRCERAERIWSKYLHSDASTPLNVDSKVRQRIQQLLPNAPMDLFDEASEFAFSLLSFDCYRKFVGSETYQKWLNDAKKKPKWNFLFFKKKTSTDKQAIMTKSESVLLLQKHVALTGGGKK